MYASCSKKTVIKRSDWDGETSKNTSSSHQISTQDQQNMVSNCRLVRMLSWLKETSAFRVALQVLVAFLFLLYVWALIELQLVLPCLVLCRCFFDELVRRVVNTVCNWITTTYRGLMEEEDAPN